MSIQQAEILDVIHAYIAMYPDDAKQLRALLSLIDKSENVCSRKEFRGHITASGVIVGERQKMLVIKHRSLDKWLHPGGHLEEGDTTLLGAALRECSEELGVSEDLFSAPGSNHQIPIDIDRHVIPANSSKNEPEHEHWDFRYQLRMPSIKIDLQEEEVAAWSWIDSLSYSEKISKRIRAGI